MPSDDFDKCARCAVTFDPDDWKFDGRGQQDPGKPWCRACVNRCHEDNAFGHECPICATPGAVCPTDDGHDEPEPDPHYGRDLDDEDDDRD